MKKQDDKLKKEWKNILFNTLFAALTLIIVIIVYKKVLLTSILLAIISVVGLIKWKSKITLIVFILGAIWGPFSEAIARYFGVWNYSISSVFNIPIWLLLVWGNAAAFLYETGKEIHRLGVREK